MAEDLNKYLFMHKNTAVAEIELDEDTGVISAISNVYGEDHVPVGVPVKNGVIDRRALNNWWKGRAIPASRMGIQDVLMELNLTSTQMLLRKCLGLSLSDHYWICPVGFDIAWSDVNFFDNSFSDDVGNLLFGSETSDGPLSLMSPDNTSDGWLKKKWIIIGGKRCLIKGGSGAIRQEPYNEVMASRIMERLDIPHVTYTLSMQNGYPYSVCEDFITKETELIPAWHIMQIAKKPNNVSLYHHYINCCNALEIPGVTEALDRMLVLDYLIANEDRHWNNFGAVRNADTLEYIGPAPIYDNGTSLWFDKPTFMIHDNQELSSKPFKKSHEEQIKLVSSFDWLDISALNDIEEEWRQIAGGSLLIDKRRCDAICMGIRKRVESLQKVTRG